MDLKTRYRSDINLLLSKKHQFGADNWTTEDNRIGKGSPFSTRDAAIMLSEFGYGKNDKTGKGIAEAIFKTHRKMVVENPHRRLGKMKFCKMGEVSGLATKRYNELRARVN